MMTAVVGVGVGLIGLDNKERVILELDASDEYQMAYDDNVIVLIIDTFGREAYYEELGEDAEAFNFLHDFTFYRKHDSIYNPTFPSLNHLLTEYEFDATLPDEVFLKNAYTSDTAKYFFDELHSKGYYVGIYSLDVHPKDYMVGMIDNITTCKVEVNRKEVMQNLLKTQCH